MHYPGDREGRFVGQILQGGFDFSSFNEINVSNF